MLKVKQFRYGADNLGYLVYGATERYGYRRRSGGRDPRIPRRASASPCCMSQIPTAIPDHTSGNGALLAGSQARLLTGADLSDGARIGLDDGPDPDHPYTRPYGGFPVLLYRQGPDCRRYPLQRDDRELFFGRSGGILPVRQEADGASRRDRWFTPATIMSGIRWPLRSISNRKTGPSTTSSRAYDPQHVFSTLAEEKKINPYFRFNEPGIVNLLARRGLPRQTEWERWQSLMSIE